MNSISSREIKCVCVVICPDECLQSYQMLGQTRWSPVCPFTSIAAWFSKAVHTADRNYEAFKV